MSRILQLCLCGGLAAWAAGCAAPQGAALSSPKASPGKVGSRRPPIKARSEPDHTAAHARYAMAVINELNGETEAALADFYKAAWDDPSNEWLVLEVSRRLIQHKRLDRAAEVLSRAAALPDSTGHVLARLAMVYSQLGRLPESQKAGRDAIRKAPATLAGYQSLFVNFMQAKQHPDALATLNAAAKAPNPAPDFLVGLSELHVSYGLQVAADKETVNATALALLKRARGLDPTDAPLKLKLADGFSMLGQGDTAAELYNELLAKTSDLPALQESVHAKLANIYLRSSNKEKAAEQLKALLKSDPTNPQPYYFLGHLALDQQKTADAVDYFSKTIVLSPDFEQAYYEMANAQLVLDKPLDALNTLEKAREKFAAGFAMEFFSAIASTRLKDYDRALRHFTAAEVIANATDPKRLNHFFHFQLGIAYEQKKEHEQAAKAFEKSLELSPDFTDAMNYLGYMWADLGTNLDKAVLLLEKAVKAEPKNAAYLDSLGWACFKLNRLPEALEHVAKAVELSEEPDAVLFDHLGDILATMGRMEKAVEAWEKSLKVETKDEVKRKIEKARPNP